MSRRPYCRAPVLLPRAAKPLHQIHARERHIKLVPAGVFDDHVIAFGVALRDLAKAQELGHAVLAVDHIIARLEVDNVGRKGLARSLRRRPSRDRVRSFEQIFGPEQHQLGIVKSRAAAQRPLIR